MGRLAGLVALVTGAGQGIGRAIALAYAREGASVLATDIQELPGAQGWDAAGETTSGAIRTRGGIGEFFKLDVGDEAEFDRGIARAIDRFGKVDILVNNAGVVRAGRQLHTYSVEDLDFCYRVNTRGAWNGTMAAIRYFLKTSRPGLIINIVSTAGINPFRNEGPYSLTKAAVTCLTQNAASEYASAGIRVNGICPTWARTPMTQPLADIPAFKAWVPQFIPLGRMVEPAEIADMAVFLASTEAKFVTGQIIAVDGGESVNCLSLPDLGA